MNAEAENGEEQIPTPDTMAVSITLASINLTASLNAEKLEAQAESWVVHGPLNPKALETSENASIHSESYMEASSV